MMGFRSITIWDNETVALQDIASNFLIREKRTVLGRLR
jgi:hypothetical protein